MWENNFMLKKRLFVNHSWSVFDTEAWKRIVYKWRSVWEKERKRGSDPVCPPLSSCRTEQLLCRADQDFLDLCGFLLSGCRLELTSVKWENPSSWLSFIKDRWWKASPDVFCLQSNPLILWCYLTPADKNKTYRTIFTQIKDLVFHEGNVYPLHRLLKGF